MKKIILTGILILGFLLCYNVPAKAVGAYPRAITVTQPDGTTITIQKHGDEFMRWTTCGNRLVSRGEDGFYYYASFNDEGRIVRSSSRASSSSMMTSSSSPITPPPAAIARALEMRSKMMPKRHSGGVSQQSSESISLGSKPFLVLLVQFSDLRFTIDAPVTAFTNLLNQSGYSVNGGTGSVKDYYQQNSCDLFQPTFEVAGPVTLSKSYSYYGNNSYEESTQIFNFVIEACTLLDNSGFDFSRYDADNDGVIDNIFIYYAGHNEAECDDENTIWPHSWEIYSQYKYFDGKRLYHYACSSEYSGLESSTTMCGIGTFCHEFGHVIGLPDFYDTDYQDYGQSPNLYNYSLMSSGNYNNDGKTPPYLNSMERVLLGYMTYPTELVNSGSYTLQGIKNNTSYYFKTKTNGEFYIIENRKDEGWDSGLYAHGMILYHVDQSSNNVHGVTAKARWDQWNGINAYADHECFDLVTSYTPESGINTRYTDEYAKIPFPGSSNNTSFTSSSSPASKSWANVATGYDITNIAFTGGVVSFDVTNHNLGTLFFQKGYNTIESLKETYSAGESFTIKLVASSKVPTSSVFTFDGSTVAAGSSVTLTAGEHTVTAVLTYSDSTTETIVQVLKVQ